MGGAYLEDLFLLRNISHIEDLHHKEDLFLY